MKHNNSPLYLALPLFQGIIGAFNAYMIPSMINPHSDLQNSAFKYLQNIWQIVFVEIIVAVLLFFQEVTALRLLITNLKYNGASVTVIINYTTNFGTCCQMVYLIKGQVCNSWQLLGIGMLIQGIIHQADFGVVRLLKTVIDCLHNKKNNHIGLVGNNDGGLDQFGQVITNEYSNLNEVRLQDNANERTEFLAIEGLLEIKESKDSWYFQQTPKSQHLAETPKIMKGRDFRKFKEEEFNTLLSTYNEFREKSEIKDSNLRKDIDVLNSLNDILNMTNKELQKKVDELKSELNSTKKELSGGKVLKKQASNNTNGQGDSFVSSLDNSEHSDEKYREKIQKLKNEIKILGDTSDIERMEFLSKISQMKDKNQQLENNYATIYDLLMKLENEYATVSKRCYSYEKKVDTQIQERQGLMNASGVIDQGVLELGQDFDGLKNEIVMDQR